MLNERCIAVYGYGNSEEMLSTPQSGQRVFFYLNGKGIIAMGSFTADEPFSSGSVFGKKENDEFHRSVANLRTVAINKAISAAQVSEWGYNLPVRMTLCKIYNPAVANRIADYFLSEGTLAADDATAR